METSLGIEVLNVATQTFSSQDQRLERHVQELSLIRTKMEMLRHAMSLVSTEKKGGFSQEEKELLAALHRIYPHLLDRVITGFPEGMQSQELSFSGVSFEEVKKSCLEGIFVSDLKITSLSSEDRQALTRAIEGELTVAAELANQTTFDVSRLYTDRELVTRSVHEILRQIQELGKVIGRNMRV